MTNETEAITNTPDPLVPMPALWPDDPDAWQKFAHQIADEARALQPRVVFIGDSITQGWSSEGQEEWKARFAPLPAVNLGIGGDRTQNLLWRIADGAFDGITPELVVLKIGVNNLWVDVQDWGPARVSEGVAAVVAAIREACPGTKVLALGVLPTQADPANPLRSIVRAVNSQSASTLPTLDGKVRFADIGEHFLESDGTISTLIMPDGCHLSPLGYTRFADAIEPLILEMLGS